MAFAYLSNFSPSAPVLNGQAGSLIAVLDYCLVTGLGWTKDFSAGNVACYKQPAGDSHRMFLRVDDTNTTNAALRGFEAMTAVSTGTGPFPTSDQRLNGLGVYKSNTADASARRWVFLGRNGVFYLLTYPLVSPGTALTTGVDVCAFQFGSFASYKPGDTYNCLICGNTSDNSAGDGTFFNLTTGAPSTYNSRYFARAFTGLPGATVAALHGDMFLGYQPYAPSSGRPFPSPIDGGCHLARVNMHESPETAGRRGLCPGFWQTSHSRDAIPMNTVLDGTVGTPLAGKSFLFFSMSSSSGGFVLEISDTWDAS